MAKKKSAAVEGMEAAASKPRAKRVKHRAFSVNDSGGHDSLPFGSGEFPSEDGLAAGAKRQLCEHDIGDTAGLVWNSLAEASDQTVAALKKSVKAPADLVLAAIGWLAREGKLEFEQSGRALKVRLR